ncbi:MAG: YitT family protein [Lachnospiraceae bacterium]
MGKKLKLISQTPLRYGILTAAAFIYASGISLFLDPHNVVPGGVTGIAMILSRFLPMKTGTLLLLLNIPILLLGFYKFGGKFLISTIYTTLAVSFFTDLTSGYASLTESELMASVIGNILIAVSLGVVFKCGATTGGMDIVVKILRLKYPHMKTGSLYLAVDLVIVGTAGLVFWNIDAASYAFIGILVMSYVFDLILYGKDEAKMIYIISGKSKEIAKRVLDEISIGITFLNGRGAYSGKTTDVILCVVRKNLSPKVEEIVKETDPDAFLIICGATEIYGEGYKDILAQKV